MKVTEIAGRIGGRMAGDGDPEIGGIASLQSATARDVVFVESDKQLAAALGSGAGAVIAGEFAAEAATTKPMIIVDQPRLAFARVAAILCSPERAEAGVHWSAVVHDSVRLGKAVAIGAHAVVSEGVTIGDKSSIGAGCFVGAGVQIGEGCDLKPNVSIYAGTRLGARVIVHSGAVLGSDGFGFVRDSKTGHYTKFPQVGRLEIGDDVEIGANCTVDRGALDATVIGRGTKLDNMVHVAHNAQLGEDIVIAAQTGISGSAVLEDGVIVAGQVGIADHVRIEKGVILGAQCGVPTSKVIRGSGMLFWGTPARPIREYLKELAVLARLARKKE
jgi:UDP-3-O-[3-hydroxymyristoyl] glucosamine N-acyltransferase